MTREANRVAGLLCQALAEKKDEVSSCANLLMGGKLFGGEEGGSVAQVKDEAREWCGLMKESDHAVLQCST
jgi:hypothetical protein